MPRFVPGRAVVTDDPVVEVEGPLPPGRHRFQLVVVDELGNESEPAVVVVMVRGSVGPGGGIIDRIGRVFGRRPPPPPPE